HEHHDHEHHDHEHHDHEHHDHEHHHHHSHTTWKEIRSLIESSSIPEGAKKRAIDIFSRIAEAEAQVHGKSVEDVAFHEVGAVDSIIDIVGAAVCLDILAPERITSSPIELGGGTVECAHGILPVPAPATQLLCKGLPVKTGGFDHEMTTPTGAAILASCVDEFIANGSFTEIRTGYGIGTRKLKKPNILRVSWREEVSKDKTTASSDSDPWLTEDLIQIDTNIDDMDGEAMGHFMQSLFDAGALDVTFTPCVMKKSRPGTIVSILTDENHADALRRCLFTGSTTIGFRETAVTRRFLRRQEHIVTGSFGTAHAKTSFFGEQALRTKIEFEDRLRVAREQGITLREAEQLIAGELEK
ncbi:nickel pincer cofactor biosynthesis protein LarC, partial [Sediminispirochaeta bajacaliforniensis]|uniref:nickel pincer cofactor biosynthesis protein LarC n=1 Tax=Sediminispirochaeta bajacaliforniensis TaxID=148 RepID=UPI000376EA5C